VDARVRDDVVTDIWDGAGFIGFEAGVYIEFGLRGWQGGSSIIFCELRLTTVHQQCTKYDNIPE
jgi:hypothetical protein